MEFYEGYESSTHQPLLRAALDAYNPKFVLELGIGDYSTPFLSEVPYLGIENNLEWIGRIKKGFSKLGIIHHPVDFQIGTRFVELSEDVKQGLRIYYNNIYIPRQRPNLLFVDNWTACRAIAINTLRKKFDLIIFHDCQPEGLIMYSYDLVQTTGFKMMFLKSPTSWTALMYKEAKELNIQKYIDEYLKEWPDCDWMKLTNEYL